MTSFSENLSSIDQYGLSGFSPAICGIVEALYTKIHLPVLTRFLIHEKSHLMVEYYQQELRNMPMACIYRDHLDKILMIGSPHLDDKYPDAAKENYNTEYYPVAVLDIKTKSGERDKKLYITYGDFKYYLMKADESAEIIPIVAPPDLSEKLYMMVEYRREKRDDDTIVSEPLEIQILATSGMNRHQLSQFQSVVPFDTTQHSNNVIYTSQEQDELYRVEPPFMMYRTPIEIKKGKIELCRFLPTNIQILAKSSTDNFPVTSLIKVQNFYPKKHKNNIRANIINVLKRSVLLAIDAVSSIPEGTEYKDEEDLSELYRCCIRFLSLHHELVTTGMYTLPWNSVITENHKKLAITSLSEMFEQIKSYKL